MNRMQTSLMVLAIVGVLGASGVVRAAARAAAWPKSRRVSEPPSRSGTWHAESHHARSTTHTEGQYLYWQLRNQRAGGKPGED